MTITNSGVDSFLGTLRRSRLIDDARLEECCRALEARGSLPNEPGRLAEMFVEQGLITPFQSKALLQGKHAGLVIIGKYKVLDLIGVGGGGRVFLCEHLMLRRLVAVKVLPIESTSSSEAVERFYREGRAVAALDHPNIVRVFDIDHAGRFHFMVMEHVDGNSLHTVIEKAGPLSAPRAAHYIAQAAIGLHHAHQAGWVHRDVKPGNILLDRNGCIKILDLGLARLLRDEGDHLTKIYDDKRVLGTADYIAPEQVEASSTVDLRADIYSLGATLYYLLTGGPPFADGSTAMKLVWHQMGQPRHITTFRSDVPAELLAIVDRMMAKRPEARFSSALEVVEALSFLTNTPISPPTAEEMPAPFRYGPASSRSTGSKPMLQLSPQSASQHSSASASSILKGTPPSSTRMSASQSASATPSPSSGDTAPVVWRGRVVGGGKSTPPAAEAKPTRPVEGGDNGRKRWTDVLRKWVKPSHDAADEDVVPAMPSAAVSVPSLEEVFLSSGRRTLVVAQERNLARLGKANLFPTLATALERVEPGDVVRIVSGGTPLHFGASMCPEPTVLDGKQVPPGVTIEGVDLGGEPLVEWPRPLNPATGQPLLVLSNLQRLSLRGFRFNGFDRWDTLLKLSGYCPGITLENLHFHGFRGVALVLDEAAGEREERLLLRRLRFTYTPAQANAVAISCKASSEAAVQEATLSECRFEGPCPTALRCEGSLDHFELRNNRFHRIQTVCHYLAAEPRHRLRVTMQGNTFCQVGTVLQLDALPMLDGRNRENRVVLKNNLFMATRALARLEEMLLDAGKVRALFPAVLGNVREPAACQEGIFFPEIQAIAVEPLQEDPTKDASYLCLPTGSPIRKLGHEGSTVGAC